MHIIQFNSSDMQRVDSSSGDRVRLPQERVRGDSA